MEDRDGPGQTAYKALARIRKLFAQETPAVMTGEPMKREDPKEAPAKTMPADESALSDPKWIADKNGPKVGLTYISTISILRRCMQMCRSA